MADEQKMLSFQRLDVYRCAVKFLGLAAMIASRVPRGHGDLVDQLRRASLSISLNIAEGTGRHGRDAMRFYSIARGSALECAAILDAVDSLALISDADYEQERALLERIVAMLTKMVGNARSGGR